MDYTEHYIALLASHDKIEQERDQLQARVAELEDFIKSAPVSTGYCCCGSDMGSHDTQTHPGIPPKDAWDHESELILNRQPSQSLAALEARVLREYGKKYQQYRMDGGVMAGGGWMQTEAVRIEAKAKGDVDG